MDENTLKKMKTISSARNHYNTFNETIEEDIM